MDNMVVCDIYYNGLGSNFRTYFCEEEFRQIIKNVYLKYVNIEKLTEKQLHYYSEVINNPLNCSLDKILKFTGAKKV